MADTIYLNNGDMVVVFDLEADLIRIAQEHLGESYVAHLSMYLSEIKEG